jgi:hypothetical protein
MPAYLSVDQFKVEIEFLRPEDVDALESRYAGFTAQKLLRWSEFIDARLKKRYAVPFNLTTPPSVIVMWLVDLTTQSLLNRRGYNADDPQMVRMEERTTLAHAQLLEAANSRDALFDLPFLQGGGDSAVTQGGPMFYSETSPYVWQNVQECAGRSDDCAGFGDTATPDTP